MNDMPLSRETLKNIVRYALNVRDVELTCDQCLDQLDRYVEQRLAGKELPEALRLVEEHLGICGQCNEQFEALLAALRGLQAEG